MREIVSALVAPATGGHGGSKSPVALLVVGLLFVLIGGSSAINPRWQWRMSRWAYKNPEANEPSDKAFTVMRVGGALFAILGVVLVVVAITKL